MQEIPNREKEIRDVRERVLVALSVIARPEVAAESSGLPPERLGYELCRLWFEAVYDPGLWTVDGLKAYRDPQQIAAFGAAFDAEECAYLERFNRFIELRLEMTRDELKRQQSIDPDRWDGIVRDARNTLELIEPEFSVDRARIGTLLRLGRM